LVVAPLILGKSRRNQNCRSNDCGENAFHGIAFWLGPIHGLPYEKLIQYKALRNRNDT
jgi:hypothetical protein